MKVIRTFNQGYHIFHQDLSHNFIKQLEKAFDKNVSTIRVKTGLTKATVINAINNQLKEVTDVLEKQKSILAAAFTEINSYCYHRKVPRMPTLEFYRAMQSYADSHVSICTHFDKIMETGLIEQDEIGVYLVFDKPVKKRTNDEYLKFISDGFDHLVSTVIYNKNKPEHLSKLFQRQVLSSQIPPKKSVGILDKTNEILAVALEEISNLFSENEEDVPIGTYPDIAVQFLHYNENLTEEYNHEKT
jgi:hypothetical protein